jgi:hypothetical protein
MRHLRNSIHSKDNRVRAPISEVQNDLPVRQMHRSIHPKDIRVLEPTEAVPTDLHVPHVNM